MLLLVPLLARAFVAYVKPPHDDRGQTTAEYALVLLGAAAVALALVAWAAKSGKITDLLDGVLDKILSNL